MNKKKRVANRKHRKATKRKLAELKKKPKAAG